MLLKSLLDHFHVLDVALGSLQLLRGLLHSCFGLVKLRVLLFDLLFQLVVVSLLLIKHLLHHTFALLLVLVHLLLELFLPFNTLVVVSLHSGDL